MSAYVSKATITIDTSGTSFGSTIYINSDQIELRAIPHPCTQRNLQSRQRGRPSERERWRRISTRRSTREGTFAYVQAYEVFSFSDKSENTSLTFQAVATVTQLLIVADDSTSSHDSSSLRDLVTRCFSTARQCNTSTRRLCELERELFEFELNF